MILITVFILSTLLLAINIAPFKTVGIFISVCYLPGLSVFVLSKRSKILFEDLILAFPFSVGISSALTLVLLLASINIMHIALIIHIAVGAAAVYYWVVKNKGRGYTAVDVSRQELLFLLSAFALTLLLSSPFFFGANRLAIAGHAFHHSSMVSQIMSGIFPPENPGLGGTAIGYYWGFHAFIAALTAKSNLHQLQIMFIINVLSLYSILCIAYSFAKAFDLPELCCYIMPIAIIGLMRSDAGILFVGKIIAGDLPSLRELTASPEEPYGILMTFIEGVSWIDTRLLFLRKFYQVTGMPLSISLSFTYLLLLLILLKDQIAEKKVYLVNMAVVIFACLLNYPPLAIFILLHAPLWTCFVFFLGHGNIKDNLRDALRIAVPYIIAILLISPYMLFVIKSRSISSSGQGGLFSFDFYEQSYKNMAVFFVPFPLILSGAWIAFRKFSYSKEMYFLFSGTVLCLVLTVLTRWPFDNSYKFNYILTLYFALFFVFALYKWLPFITSRLLNGLTTSVIVFCLLLTPIMVDASHIVSSLSTAYRIIFSDKHLVYAQDKKRNEAYSWIRKNIPSNALIMLSYVETKWSCCGFNDNYEPAAIAERNLYVIKDRDYTISNPEYERRILYREKLFADPDDPEVDKFFTLIGRPVYLLIEDGLPESFFVEERFKPFPVNLGKNFDLKFDNGRQQVYLINSVEASDSP